MTRRSGPATRPITLADAGPLARVLADGWAFFAPWDAVRDESFFTPDGQEADIRAALDRAARGAGATRVILDEHGTVVGRIDLNSIVRGAFQSASLGYRVAEAAGGRGIATAAVAEMVAIAFGPLGLHRVEAATLLHNIRSQRVLEKNGFIRFGLAPRYLAIDGRWQDHVLFQRLAD